MLANLEQTINKQKWATPGNIPDPVELPRIPGFEVLVRPYAVPEKIGSIILPDQYKDDASFLLTVGKVLVVGEQAYKEERFGGPWCAVGDWIVWPKHHGSLLDYKGVKLRLISDDMVKMVVKSPEDFMLDILPSK